MRICKGCGAVAPTANKNCRRCSSHFENNTVKVEPLSNGRQWALVKGKLGCRSCGFEIGVNGPDMEGSITCGQCGIPQKFSRGLWEEFIVHAHNVADLAGHGKPNPGSPLWKALEAIEGEGFVRMYKSIGRNKSTLTESYGDSSDLDWSFEVSPGHPLCEKCREPLNFQPEDSRTIVGCPKCGEQWTYLLPKEGASFSGLVGLISDDRNIATPRVKVESSAAGAVTILKCPNCAGNLDASDVGGIVKCGFCSTTCRITAGVQRRLSGEKVPAKDWWMLFEGASPQRKKLEKAVEKTNRKKALKKEKEELRRKKAFKTKVIVGSIVLLILAAVAVVIALQ